MKKIILFTKMSSIQKHWEKALFGAYNRVHMDDEKKLVSALKIDILPITVMIDELSLVDAQKTLKELNALTHVTILLFNSIPEVYHASTLLGENVKGYENTFLDKINLLKMLQSIENGKSWLFVDLTNYIINKFIEDSKVKEPDFVALLTLKEKDIALMIANGLCNKEIASAEKIALSTVKRHVSKIFTKAGVTDRVSLALKFK